MRGLFWMFVAALLGGLLVLLVSAILLALGWLVYRLIS